jgi:hypothetical protein
MMISVNQGVASFEFTHTADDCVPPGSMSGGSGLSIDARYPDDCDSDHIQRRIERKLGFKWLICDVFHTQPARMVGEPSQTLI